MALIKLIGGGGVEVTAEQGCHYWNVLNGHEEPQNDGEENFCNTIHKIYLNWQNAPYDYILARMDTLQAMYHGTPTVARLQKRIVWALDERKRINE